MFERAPPDVTESILEVACTIPALVASLLGAGSVCKEARRAYHARKTPLDGSVRHVNGDWFLLRGGMCFQERETEAESLSDPFSIRIVRDRKPGRPVFVFLVLDEEAMPGVGMVVRASRVSARNFVSVFCTKDVHQQAWKSVHLGQPCFVHTDRRERINALPTPLPLADKEMCVWPSVFPETRPHPGGFYEITGNVAVHVPVDVESHSGLPSDPDNCPAVFGRDLLDVAGFGEPPCTLNRVPGVLSVDTPTPSRVFDSPAHTEEGRDARVRYFLQRHQSSALVRLDPPPKRASAEGAARLIVKHANLLNATSSSGAMPLGLKSQVVEEFEAQHGVSDARFADVEETSDCDEGDRHDSDYKPGRPLHRDGPRRDVRRRRH
jgi:hypothetical protein